MPMGTFLWHSATSDQRHTRSMPEIATLTSGTSVRGLTVRVAEALLLILVAEAELVRVAEAS